VRAAVSYIIYREKVLVPSVMMRSTSSILFSKGNRLSSQGIGMQERIARLIGVK